jgi:hypothetical protein
MKRTLLAGLSLMIALHSFAAFALPIDTSLEQAFHRNFPDATDVRWTGEVDGYSVSFVERGIRTRVTFDKKGKFTGELRNYTAEYLPFYLTNLLKQQYPRYEIIGVTEVTAATDINYFVKVMGPKYWMTICLQNDGTYNVVERYRRAD